MSGIDLIALFVFSITLILTFIVSFIGRRHSTLTDNGALSEEKLNKWLIGLSAGATANSGFVVTGAVGLGYMYGLQWILLPLSVLLGDIIYWRIFPKKINTLSQSHNITTLSDIITLNINGRVKHVLVLLSAILITIGLGLYTSAQWIAGEKFVNGAFGISGYWALAGFAAIIIAYTSIGGFRGSVYVDSYQAIIRLIATTLAMVAVCVIAYNNQDMFRREIAEAGTEFFYLSPSGTLPSIIGFIIGFTAAGLGFGLGQPQIISRYMAGSSPEETQKAQWIYIFFVHYTWIAMTLFGMVLRGVIPDLKDAEAGLAVFFAQYMGSILTGIIIADIFATIAATSNSLIISISQTIKRDILPFLGFQNTLSAPSVGLICIVGLMTMGMSLLVHGGTVATIALFAVAVMGASLAPAVMIKLMRWRHTGPSLVASILCGLAVALMWKYVGLSTHMNEAAPGILAGLLTNYLYIQLINKLRPSE